MAESLPLPSQKWRSRWRGTSFQLLAISLTKRAACGWPVLFCGHAGFEGQNHKHAGSGVPALIVPASHL